MVQRETRVLSVFSPSLYLNFNAEAEKECAVLKLVMLNLNRSLLSWTTHQCYSSWTLTFVHQLAELQLWNVLHADSYSVYSLKSCFSYDFIRLHEKLKIIFKVASEFLCSSLWPWNAAWWFWFPPLLPHPGCVENPSGIFCSQEIQMSLEIEWTILSSKALINIVIWLDFLSLTYCFIWYKEWQEFLLSTACSPTL